MATLSAKRKLAIFRRDGFTCQYCLLDASRDFDTWWHANLNVDHIDPRGGDNDLNLVTACRACNLYKRNHPCKSLPEAREYVDSRRDKAREWFTKYVRPAGIEPTAPNRGTHR
jgi:5-methylcytosine-specific restriction endonuclease McrA